MSISIDINFLSVYSLEVNKSRINTLILGFLKIVYVYVHNPLIKL